MRVTAIIPAYNEENRIENVIIPALETEVLSNIIVIDDGSEDLTSEVASKFNIELIKLPKNVGKADAIKQGIQHCRNNSDIIVFLDGDLMGLTSHHLHQLISPVLQNEFDMTIGVFKSGRHTTDLAQMIAPNLSGQRAMKSYIAHEILDLEVSGYGIEVAISKLIKKKNLRTAHVFWENVSHVTKEEKVGISKGSIWRMKMYKDIVKHWLH